MAEKHSKNLTRADDYLAKMLTQKEQAVVTPYAFFRLIQAMYREGKSLYLRDTLPNAEIYYRRRRNMYKAGIVRFDRDYGSRLIRVLTVSEQSAEEIVCIADPLCYVSHMSAMQRWGLTNRSSKALICTRPVRKIATAQLSNMMASHSDPLPPKRFRLVRIGHPQTVRNRPIRVFESKAAGASVNVRGSDMRLATIGQTFLDMLQQPELCGGISHVLDVYDEHAAFWHNEIIASVDSSNSSIVKCRAGHILEERLRLHHKRIESWKALAQRGGSRRLDPSKAYARDFSETWMISLNV